MCSTAECFRSRRFGRPGSSALLCVLRGSAVECFDSEKPRNRLPDKELSTLNLEPYTILNPNVGT